MTRITLIAAVAALLVAAIAWFATGGFGLNDAPDTPPEEPTTVQEETPAAPTVDQQVDEALAKLTLEQKVSQMFILTPEGLTGADVVSAAGDVTRLALSDRPVGGVCYFEQNLETPQQTREMLATVQGFSNEACGLPLFLCVDEEGGEVARIANNEAYGVENTGSTSSFGESGNTTQAAQAARSIATYLADLGFNVDFAPVADISTNEDGAMVGRAFGNTAATVSPLVEAQVKAFNEVGILCAAKHFPGIGGAFGDSHYSAISTDRTLGEMQNEEFKPFQAAIAAGVPMIMVGHISATEVTGDAEPASLSKTIITDILRGQLGYQGIVITDSMAMGAITDSYDNSEIGVKAIQAGADIILMPSNFEATFRGVMGAITSGQISEERIDESVRRIIKAKLTMKDTTPKVNTSANNQASNTQQSADNTSSSENTSETDAANAFEAAIAAGQTDPVAGSDAVTSNIEAAPDETSDAQTDGASDYDTNEDYRYYDDSDEDYYYDESEE